ncbi:MAG TPA: isoprenyl transferase [Flavobacteriales bacterium]|nr:isoprenyl transferase [Flavobacteriales bacterium]
MAIDSRIDQSKLPNHVAVIMDGNGRWAKQRGKLRTFGHNKGVKAVRETVETAAEIGIEYLTLYAFSTENWNRPKFEINALMTLLVKTISKETKTLTENNIRLNAIGDLESLPVSCLKELNEAIEKTKDNTRMTLTLALSYSSKWEITEAIKAIAKNVKSGELDVDAIDESTINQHLCTIGIPDPELLIRTSGEHRISNFLLWQIAYAELYFTDKLWPDFERVDFETAIIDYQGRERRFGKISEQVSA